VTGAEDWLAGLVRALHRENVDGWHCDQVLAEVRQHLGESGEDPFAAFGAPEQYARVVAGELAGELAGDGGPPSVSPPLLAVEGVAKSFRRHRVLDGVDLRVAAGEVAAVVGPNGAGKSTLLRICAGLESPDAGRVTVHGGLGYCPQQPALVDLLRADEHFDLVGAGRGMGRAEARRAGAELAARLDWLPDRRPVGELSGGTRQKLNVVLAALGEPDVLLLDEPCSALDPIATGKVEDLIQELQGEFSILIVTHNMQQASRVSDYTAFMYLGRLIEYGPTSEIFTRPKLKETESYVTGRFG